MLYKRGNIWWVKFRIKGNLVQRSARTASKREAAKVERDLRDQAARELHSQRTGKVANKTYSDAIVKWVHEGGPKSMHSHARNTRPYLDDTPLHLVVPKAHAMKGDMLRRGLSPQTINRRLAVVRRVLNVAYKEWDWLSEPLGQKIKLLSEKGMSREFYLTQEEVDLLISHVTNAEAAKVIKLAAYTGLRKTELLSLTPDQWQPPYLILNNKTKSKKGRPVPVIDDIQDLVTLPFTCSYHDVRRAFELAREAIERPDIRFHDMRHSYASWLAKNPNVPFAAIRDLLGHSSLTVTSKYAHLRGSTFDVVTDALKK